MPRSCHLSTFCAWNWGPQPQFEAASNGDYADDVETMRGPLQNLKYITISGETVPLMLMDPAYVCGDGDDNLLWSENVLTYGECEVVKALKHLWSSSAFLFIS